MAQVEDNESEIDDAEVDFVLKHTEVKMAEVDDTESEDICEVDEGVVEFLPGFSKFSGTTSGGCLQGDGYSITFSEVLSKGVTDCFFGSTVSLGFEGFYNWADVMHILQYSLENCEDDKTTIEFMEEELTAWFLTYDGWGLLSSLLPKQQHLDILNKLMDLKKNWQLEQEYSELECWWLFAQDIDFATILPEFQVDIKEGNFGSEAGRQKWINLKFITPRCNLEVKFMAVKKQKMEKGNLVSIAAAAVAKQLEDFDEIDHLNIPKTLMEPVTQMMEDVRLDKGNIPYEII